MTQRNSAKGKKRRKKPEKLEFVQDFIPIKELRHGIIETTDGRYIKILEIEPINFMLRSDDEQFSIISTFASWLKISPIKLQFKSITRRADSDKHVAMVREELEAEPSEECKHLGEDYINLIKDVGSREALTRRFFLIFQYEEIRRNETDDFSQIYNMMQTAEQNARAYFMQCGNNILQPEDSDEATAEILYMFFNRRSCVNEPFSSRVERVVLDTMAAKNKVIGIDEVPHIRFAHFIAPRGIDLKHHNYVVMDGLYYTFLYIKGDGYPSRVRAGWMSALINAGEGVDIDVHLRRENRSKTIDKVAQRIRLNRTKIKSMQDTSTDYEELANSIQAGYYIKHGIANYNEDLFYMSVFVTVSAKTYEELMWRKQQMIDMLKSMDMYVSDCRFQQETALRSVMPFLKIAPSLEKKAKRNVLTSGAASTPICSQATSSRMIRAFCSASTVIITRCVSWTCLTPRRTKTRTSTLSAPVAQAKPLRFSSWLCVCECAAYNALFWHRLRDTSSDVRVMLWVVSSSVLLRVHRTVSTLWRSDIRLLPKWSLSMRWTTWSLARCWPIRFSSL